MSDYNLILAIPTDGWKIINRQGSEIAALPSGVLIFIDGLMRSKVNGKWGLINDQQEELTTFKYDYLSDFYENRAVVEVNGKYGFINKEGSEVISIKYDYATDFEGLAGIELNGKSGVVDYWGREYFFK